MSIPLGYDEIVDEKQLYALLPKAAGHFRPAPPNNRKTALIAVDFTNDFVGAGLMSVKGASEDLARLLRFMYDNLFYIDEIAATADWHNPNSITFTSWWRYADGSLPENFTQVPLRDTEAGVIIPQFLPYESKDYVRKLDALGLPTLTLWAAHGIPNTVGACFDGQFANMLYAWELLTGRTSTKILKGQDSLSEMYGAFYPEINTGRAFSSHEHYIGELQKYDTILFCGEAFDYCAGITVEQACAYYGWDNKDMLRRFVVLRDCASDIDPNSGVSTTRYARLQNAGVRVVNSTEFSLVN
ncbi:hypothetical protein AGMMS49975_11330 [Clostridia bacterium]|nr:hypothetical protein AGMMS49975_11330 [Clostridia bacterium]